MHALTLARLIAAGLLAGALLMAASRTPAQVADAGLALRGATIYAAPDSPPLTNGTVIVRNGKIEQVGPASQVAPASGMRVVDLSGLVLVAGFWNSHVHFSGSQWDGAATAPAPQLNDAFEQMLTRWGFSTVFDTGSNLENTLALKRRVESGAVNGPRIFTTGDILYPRGTEGRRFQILTPGEATAAVNSLLDGGADAIKVYAQTFWDLKLTLSPEVLAAVRAETRRRGVQMFAHPSNRDGLYNSVDVGVDVVVHTTPQIGPWGGELVAKMKAANIAVIPTLQLWRFELQREKAPADVGAQFQRRGVDQLREYWSAGGDILFGTDVGYMTDFTTVEEFQKMAQSGMGYRDILASLTTTPARRRGLASSAGRVAPGFEADFTVLRGDPARTVDAFADVAYTIRGGRIIYQADSR